LANRAGKLGHWHPVLERNGINVWILDQWMVDRGLMGQGGLSMGRKGKLYLLYLPGVII
jgi:hypothetical protein